MNRPVPIKYSSESPARLNHYIRMRCQGNKNGFRVVFEGVSVNESFNIIAHNGLLLILAHEKEPDLKIRGRTHPGSKLVYLVNV
jgi:hypothetical protein